MPSRKVLLIDPPTPYLQKMVNMGLGWLAANIKEATSDLQVIPLANIHCSVEKAEKILYRKIKLLFEPDIVGFSINCNTYRTVLSLINNIRGYYKGLVAIGGPHAVFEGKNILNDNRGVDLVVMGEAEHTFSQICQRSYGEYEDLEGVAFRRQDTTIETPFKSLKKEFGNLHYPDYRQFGIRKIFVYPILTSRGCPFGCSFCYPFRSKIWRPRPMSDVFDELTFAKKTFDIETVAIVDDAFNFKPERLFEFCEEYIRKDINLPWFCPPGLRADSITPEAVKVMKRAGCTRIILGIETLVPEVFRHMNKGQSIEDIKKAAQIIKEEKMPSMGYFIIGLPYETLERARLNYKLAKELGLDATQWRLLVPYPGTTVYEWMKKNGRIYHEAETAHREVSELFDTTKINVACDTPDFTKQERLTAFWEINTKIGNYIISFKDSPRKRIKVLLKAVIKYDVFRILWHIANIYKRRRGLFRNASKDNLGVWFKRNVF